MHLSILPDPSNVLFVLVDAESVVVELVPPARFLDMLLALSAAMRFGPACSMCPDPAELLPWAGNV